MRLLVCFVLLSLGMLGIWLLFGAALEQWLSPDRVTQVLQSWGGWAWALGILLLVADLLLPIPGTVVMSALGFLYGGAIGGLVAAAGNILSGVVGYGVGRLTNERTARRFLGDRDFERGRGLFAKGGGWMVAGSRALPIFPEAIACTAGLVRMPLGRFLASLSCGGVPMGFLFAWIGAAGRESPGWALAFSLLIPAVLWSVVRPLVLRRNPKGGGKVGIAPEEEA